MDGLTDQERRVCQGLQLTEQQYLARKVERSGPTRPTKEQRIDALRALLRSPSSQRERQALEARIRLIEEETE